MSDDRSIKIQVLAKQGCRSHEELQRLARELESDGIEVLLIGAATIAAQAKPEIFSKVFGVPPPPEDSRHSDSISEAEQPGLKIPANLENLVDDITIPRRHIQMDEN